MKMMHAEKHVIHVLNDLIEICKDGEKGFQTASEAVKNQNLQTLFQTISLYRAQLVPQLQEEIERLGGDPERGGSVLGALHRGWVNIKSAVATGNDEAILSECERGEDSAVVAYVEALREDLPPPTRRIVESQFIQIKKAHGHIRFLKKNGDEK